MGKLLAAVGQVAEAGEIKIAQPHWFKCPVCSFDWQTYRATLPLTLGASALAGALVTSAITGRHEAKMDATTLATVQNETVIYRQAPPFQDDSELPAMEQMEASDQQDNDVRLNFPRTVQIVRFLAPEAAGSGKLTATARESMREGLIKVGGFIVFRPKEDAGIGTKKNQLSRASKPNRSWGRSTTICGRFISASRSRKMGPVTSPGRIRQRPSTWVSPCEIM